VIIVIACSMTRQEIVKDWEWLFNNVSATLHCFDSEDEITDFVTCKIESVIATRQEVDVEGESNILLSIFFLSGIYILFVNIAKYWKI
jgi:hypothetical protein